MTKPLGTPLEVAAVIGEWFLVLTIMLGTYAALTAVGIGLAAIVFPARDTVSSEAS